MIRNGFIKDIDGEWYSLTDILSLKVGETNDLFGKGSKTWEIRAFFRDAEDGYDEEAKYLVIEENFNNADAAYVRLKAIMNGER